MDFKYYSNFWLFYKANQEEIDKLLQYFSHKYIQIIEPMEMFQEVLLRIAQSDFLKKYDPDRGSLLKTYFVHKARGYASHYAVEVQRKPRTIPIEMYFLKKEEVNNQLDSGDIVQSHIDFQQHPTFDKSIDYSIYSMEVMEQLQKKLNSTNYFIACLYFMDCYTCVEIYDILDKYAYNTVLKKIGDIKKIAENIININSMVNA